MSGRARPHVIAVVAALVLSGCAAVLWTEPSGARSDFATEVLPYFQRFCLRCHGATQQKAGLRIDHLSRDFAHGSSIEQWQEVVDRINAAEMPPEGEPHRPTAEDSDRVVAWLTGRIAEGEATRLAQRARVSFHRLTREEYAHTIHDLLGVDFEVTGPAGLNDDDGWRGFDRIGSVLSLSASHVEKYFAAAESILEEAFPDPPPQAGSARMSALDLLGGPSALGARELMRLERAGRMDRIRMDLWPGQVVRARPAGAFIQHAGRYRIRAQVSGLRSNQGLPPHLAIHATDLDRLLFERDVVAPEGEPIVVEFETHLPAGQHEFSVTNEVSGPLLLSRLGRAGRPFLSLEEGRIPWQLPLKDEGGKPIHPVLLIDWIEWRGPIRDPESSKRARFLAGTPRTLEQAIGGLRRFAAAAFRRPLARGEIDRFVQLAENEIARGEDVMSAVKSSMLAVLCSEGFLYLSEGAYDRETGALNDWELASRLSYFLWSSMPDAELFDLAREGRLGLPGVLRSQVSRMLADPKARRFVDAFSRQWLQLDRVGMFPPDAELYPDYDKHLQRSMVRETTAFFGEVLTRNLSLREFLASNWTVVNPRLARHYGLSLGGSSDLGEDRFRVTKGSVRNNITFIRALVP